MKVQWMKHRVRSTVLPAESRDMEKKIAVVDDIVILHKMKSNVLQTVVDLNHSFNELLLSMTRAYDEIILVCGTYCKDVSLKYATREMRLHGQRPIQ